MINTIEDYMKLDYSIETREVKEEGQKFIEVSIPELSGLKVYVDNYSEISEEINMAKKEWFAANIELGREIPLPR